MRRGHPLVDPVKWQTHAPAPQERTFSLSRRHCPPSNTPRTWFSKSWLRRSAPVTHQDQGIELGGCPSHSSPLAVFAAPENRPFPSPSTHRGALRHCTGLVAACPWPPRGMLQPHLAQAAGAANSLNFGAGSTRAGIQVSWL